MRHEASRRAARYAAAVLACLLAGCATTGRAPHAPPFASVPYDPFSREAAIAIAQREWRAWGAGVDDDAPGTRPELVGDAKPERQEGFWQRVGEYWFTGQDAGTTESRWTGMHDAEGHVFASDRDGDFAWSAAFISYVMRTAGATGSFAYSPNHSTYIDLARQMSLGQVSGFGMTAERVDSYAPLPGDLICTGRLNAAGMRFDDLPAGTFPAHCDIVVARTPMSMDAQTGTPQGGVLSVIGGNVDDSVTMKHVPVTADYRLAGPAGLLDTRYPWFVVLRILYAR